MADGEWRGVNWSKKGPAGLGRGVELAILLLRVVEARKESL